MTEELERILSFWELKEVFTNSLRTFVAAIDSKDPHTHGHSERVMNYSLRMARVLEWSEQTQEILKLSAILHDVGMIGVPEAILSKPGKLTREEYNRVKLHPP